MADVLRESAKRGAGLSDLAAARDSTESVIGFSTEMRQQVDELRRFLFERVYKSPLVSRQNAKADHILERLFTSLTANTRLLPRYVQQRINGSAEPQDIAREAAHFLASLTDRGALDLYGELFVPTDRAMGHHVR